MNRMCLKERKNKNEFHRDGADYGYQVVIATDGTSTIREEWQYYAMNNVATKMTTEEKIVRGQELVPIHRKVN